MQTKSHLRRCEQYLDRCRFRPDALRVLALGDSWLSLPGGLWDGHDIVEFLNDRSWTARNGGRPLNVLSFAHPGKELRHMAGDTDTQEGLAFLQEFGKMRRIKYDFEAVIVTGGGNDILPFPHRFIGAGADGSGAVLDGPLNLALDDIRASWKDILALVAPWQCPVIAHGYGPITPTLRSGPIKIWVKGIGPWVGPHLLRRLGLPVERAKALIGEVLDRLNDTMQDIDGLSWFDVRDTVASIPARDWHDEIHFFEPGWELLAQRWVAAIEDFVGVAAAPAVAAVARAPRRAPRKRGAVELTPQAKAWKPFLKDALAAANERADKKEQLVAKTAAKRAAATAKTAAKKARGAKKAAAARRGKRG